MRATGLAILVTLVAGLLLLTAPPCCAQTQERNSGPLTFVSSDIHPKTLFWIQGRFVPIDDPKYQGPPEVETILCSIRENECLDMLSDTPDRGLETTWIQEFQPVSWDKDGIVADSRSLNGCTDETLKVRFSPPSVVVINSPVLPTSDSCKKSNNAFDKLMGEKGWTLKNQMDQEMLVPTRGLVPFQDAKIP